MNKVLCQCADELLMLWGLKSPSHRLDLPQLGDEKSYQSKSQNLKIKLCIV